MTEKQCKEEIIKQQNLLNRKLCHKGSKYWIIIEEIFAERMPDSNEYQIVCSYKHEKGVKITEPLSPILGLYEISNVKFDDVLKYDLLM